MEIFTQMKILRVSCNISAVGNSVDGFGGDRHIDNDDSIHLDHHKYSLGNLKFWNCLDLKLRIISFSIQGFSFDCLACFLFIYFACLTRSVDLH